jgi:hypothetical protein
VVLALRLTAILILAVDAVLTFRSAKRINAMGK